MTLSKDYRYTVLCEDAQTKSFIVEILKAHGIITRRIKVINYPCGKGCGSAFVNREYPREVHLLHELNFQKLVLVVCTDADNFSVDTRKKMLDDSVSKNLSKWNRENRFIILFIPKREIETWIHFLRGEDVDEKMEFKHSGKPETCKEEAHKFADYCRGLLEMKTEPLPSMVEAKKEYVRVCGLQAKRGRG